LTFQGINQESHVMAKKLSVEEESRRNFVKKAAYVAPAILSLTAAPAFAKEGSRKPPIERGPGPYVPPVAD
jgi:hypothetical protein